jgi:glycosyltransferase involved in cell wall biosynthesis
MKLALNVICKDEVNDIDRIIHDYREYFDELVFAVDDQKVFDDCSASYHQFYPDIKFYKYEWVDNFAHKRNFVAGKTESEYYLRIDCDDVIENPEKIRQVFKGMVDNDISIAFVSYVYSRDKDGNCNAEHWRETIIRKRPEINWNKSVHENLCYPENAGINSFKTDAFRIIHNITPEHAEESSARNLKLLLAEFDANKKDTDPRTIAYLGRVFMALESYKLAIPFLELLIEKSGWDDDKYFAWIHLAECHKRLGNLDLASGACNEALEMNMEFPDAYISKGTVHLMRSEYDKALNWFMYGIVRKKPDTMFVIDPSIYGYRVRMYIAMAYLGKGMYRDALKWFYEAKNLAPTNPDILSKEKVFVDALESSEYVKNLLGIIKYTKDEKSVEKLIDSIPAEILKDERVTKVKNKYCKPTVWSKKSVVIYCGASWEDWTPASVLNGIGGSEEAVIYLSQELAKLGWEVTVYNQCGDNGGNYVGVTYKNYWEFNKRDTFHILIGWRRDIFKDYHYRCRKEIVWLHDVPKEGDFKDGKHRLDKVVVLSQFHKQFLTKELPDRCLFVSANGINLPDFKFSLLTRNPHRMIYTSSYDRGIEHLLEMWGEIRKEVPDAELHLFYGWKTYDEMMKLGYRSKKYRAAMSALINQEGVTDHGRVGHKELVKEFQKSGIWVYPSHFDEISCISAMKAQACGCVPVCTDYAALNETVKGGVKVNGKADDPLVVEKFKTELLKVLKDTEYQEKLRSELPDKEIFSWENVAKKWDKDLFKFEGLQYENLQDYEECYSKFHPDVNLPIVEGQSFERQFWAADFLKLHPELKTGIDIGSFDGGLGVKLSLKFKDKFVCDIQDIKVIEMEFAKKVVEENGLKTEFFTGCSFERFNSNKKYDIAFLMEVLEHTLEPQVVLKKIHDLLGDGGYLLISVPHKDGNFGRAKDELFNSSHLRDYDEETLKAEVSTLFKIEGTSVAADLIQLVAKK